MFLSLWLVVCVFMLKSVLCGGRRTSCTTVDVQVVSQPPYTSFDGRRTMTILP